VRHAPGFISASLHRSLDGTKVTMYAQWRTIEDYQAMRGNPGPAPFLEQGLAISRFELGEFLREHGAVAGDRQPKSPPRTEFVDVSHLICPMAPART
jgi:hypothetical protein